MISVIVPTYNQAQSLARAIESVWAQGVDDVEVAVVNDGSTDETEAVLHELSGRGPLRLINQDNLGPAAARNRGIRESHGELIAFLDSDDTWLPGKLHAQLEALQLTGCRFSYCGTQVIDESGDVVARYPAQDKDSQFSELVWGNRLATPTVVVQRSLLEEVGPFDESLYSGEDWDLWLRISLRARGACVPQPLVSVRGHHRWRADEGQFRKYEYMINTVLGRSFSLATEHENLGTVVSNKRHILSWHFAVLAKSCLRRGRLMDFCRLSLKAIGSHPAAVLYLTRIQSPVAD